MAFQIGEPITKDNPLPVDVGGLTLSGATFQGATSPSIAELLMLDASTKAFVFRRTIMKADGTFSVGFYDLSGVAVSPTLANLVIPLSINADGTVNAIGSGGTMTLSLSQYTAW